MTSLNKLWDIICEMLGVNIAPLHGPDRVGDIKHSLASIEKAKKLFGYEPEIDVEQGLKMTVEWAKTPLPH
jgi:nucleoside-diphosphate-sugar epimerase